MKIDTGSKYNVISQAAQNNVNPNALIDTPFTIKLVAFGAQVIPPTGFTILELNCGKLVFQVVDCEVTLLGLSDCIPGSGKR